MDGVLGRTGGWFLNLLTLLVLGGVGYALSQKWADERLLLGFLCFYLFGHGWVADYINATRGQAALQKHSEDMSGWNAISTRINTVQARIDGHETRLNDHAGALDTQALALIGKLDKPQPTGGGKKR